MIMPSSKNNKYDVGYGKPPKATQWKKGQSGNPKGRPKGTKNFYTDLSEELAEMILVNEGGRQKKLSKQQAMIKQLVSKALAGDMAANRLVLTLVPTVLEEKNREKEEDRLAGFDDEILQNYLKRNAKRKKQGQ